MIRPKPTPVVRSDTYPHTALLETKSLTKTFKVRGKGRALAVDDVSIRLDPGSTLGIVGESGCGKSTLARLIVGLIKPDEGEVLFEAETVPNGRRPAEVTRNIQMIFQDPYSALNPKASIGDSIAFPLRVHGHGRREAEGLARELLGQVGLHANHASYYPHQMSGGQRQRVNIARALVLDPKLVVCDEAVSALDKSIQAQILNLLKQLQEDKKLSYLFISHDLNVVEYMSDQVAVMYLGRIAETCPSADLYREPLHPYTQALLASLPRIDAKAEDPPLLDGELPSPLAPPSGCRFRTRCPQAMDVCAAEAPPLHEALPGHWVACHLHSPFPVAPLTGPTPVSIGRPPA
jgi:oligopeptide/dipeptide ABC transporter ATP-binding protein